METIHVKPEQPRKLEALTDDSVMPIGALKGKTMAEVPDKYLIDLWGEKEYFFRKTPKVLSDDIMKVMIYIDTHFDPKTLS